MPREKICWISIRERHASSIKLKTCISSVPIFIPASDHRKLLAYNHIIYLLAQFDSNIHTISKIQQPIKQNISYPSIARKPEIKKQRDQGVYDRLTPRIRLSRVQRGIASFAQGSPYLQTNLLVPWQAENSVFNGRHGSALLLDR